MKEKKKRGCCITIIAVPIALIVLLAVIGSLTPKKEAEERPTTEVTTDTTEVTTDTTEVTTDTIEVTTDNVSREDLIKKYGFGKVDTVNNDVTGNWRMVRYSTTADPSEFIIDYYKTFFESNDEIHILINDVTNTTTTMRCTMDNYLLSYEIHEHVDGEEESAKKLGHGEILGQYLAYVETGKIEELKPDEEELTEEQLELLNEANN